MSDREIEVERICQAALDLLPADRPAMLDEACRDDAELRSEVESLLVLEDASEPFIETPAVQMAAQQSSHAWERNRAVGTSDPMRPMIEAGSRFGQYDVRSAIGAGGMGEVYCARDTRLQREVALKVLPRAVALDPERLRRFQREAEALAALNHPNIAAIYGLEEAGGIRALILELVEGPTLADRIARGPIPVEEALAIGRQIADGVEAAHAHGIIHRDLKPANIKVRSDGVAKVLDFGLAKMIEPRTIVADPQESNMGSESAPGVLLGTPAYMAPEQLKGQPADRRVDVWAFGCVLFEMLAGRPAFEGSTTTELAGEVLRRDPGWQRLPAATPASIQRLIRRCLNKDPRHRLHDMADVRIEIEESSSSSQPDVLSAGRTRRRGEGLAWISAVAVLGVAIAATATLVVRKGRSELAAPETRLEITTPPTTDPASLAISPDGRHAVFVATFEGRPRLWLRSLADVAARPLAGTDFAALPFWAPDARSIGFFADWRLKRLDLDGGTVQPLARIEVGFGGTWMHDRTILFSSGPARPIFRIADTGGAVLPVTRLQGPQTGHRFPQALPDGRHVLYYVTGGPESTGVYVARVDGSDARRLFAADSAATYAASGHLLFVRQDTLYAVRFDPATLRTVGDPFPLADRMVVNKSLGVAAVSAAATGLIVYRQSSTQPKQQFIWFDRGGHELGRLGDAADAGPAHPSLSPGGDRLVVTRARGGNPDVWLLDMAHSRWTPFTRDPSTEIYPVWSPDARRIVFGSNRRGRGGLELYQQSSAAGDPGERIVTPDGLTTVIPDDWSPDGRFIIYRGLGDPRSSFDLWVVPVQPPGNAFALIKTDFEERDAQLSPDGKWIAYHSDESGRFEVYVQPFMTPGARMAISTEGGTQVRWSRNGQELFYIAFDGRLIAVPTRSSSDGNTLDAGRPVPLFMTRILGGLPGQGNHRQQYVVSPDAQRFLVHSIVAEETSSITAVLNWRPGLDSPRIEREK